MNVFLGMWIVLLSRGIMGRVDWDTYFMEMAYLVSKRSTCIRRHHGSVLVRDNRILATGYNGSASGYKHCSETGCILEKLNIPSG